MATIYVSSTYEDLKEFRDAVMRALRKLTGHQIRGMEDYAAGDERPIEKCRNDVASSDVYVGIYGWRYGYIPEESNPEKRSITECEYRVAQDQKECVIFLLDKGQTTYDFQTYADKFTGAGDNGQRIAALREELGKRHTASFFRTPDDLAAKVTVSITNWLARQAHAGAGEPVAPSKPVVQHREIKYSLLLLHAPADAALARRVGDDLAPWLERQVLLNAQGLFAANADDFAALEADAAASHAAAYLLTPGALDQLKPREAMVAQILGAVAARTEAMACALSDVVKESVPPSWPLSPVFDLGPAGGPAPAAGVLKPWLDQVSPEWNRMHVGLPTSVIAMTQGELAALLAEPSMVGDQLGVAVQKKFEELRHELDTLEIPWQERYGATRETWCPFGGGGTAVAGVLMETARSLNQRGDQRLRDRSIKLQSYPLDGLKDPVGPWVPIYTQIALSGCVVLVDELSLFHPAVSQSFIGSPFFNNPQVAFVTISPYNPQGEPLNQVLEAETRRRLATAFTRFAMDLDPQCEFAVGDERHLRRWLFASLPTTLNRLGEPPPDRIRLQSFREEIAAGSRRTPGYAWGGGAKS